MTYLANEVLRTLLAMEKRVVAGGGRSLMMRMMASRTLDDRINGVVLTFTDLSPVRKLAGELNAKSG